MRPRLEPVDDGAVDERGEVPGADAKLIADGGEAQAHVQVLAHLVEEKVPQVFRGVDDPRALALVAHRVAHLILLLVGHEVGDVPGRQQVVDVHQEPLVDDLPVRHQERHGVALDASLDVQAQQVSLEVRHAVGGGDRDLEHVVLADERRELGERLLARAAHAHEHSVAAREVEDARHARDVVHRLFEQHQIHHRV